MTPETSAVLAAAGYGPGTGYKRCWNCEHFTLPAPAEPGTAVPTAVDAQPVHTCAVLGSPVEPTAVCDRWVQMADRARKRTGFRSALRQHGSFLWDEEATGKGPSRQGGGGPVGL